VIVLVVLAVAVLAAAGAYALSATRRVAADPIDPTAEERALQRWLLRRPRLRRFLRERFDRERLGGFLLTIGFVIVFGVAVGLGVILQLIERNDVLSHADRSVSEWGADHASSRAVDVLRGITQLGSTLGIAIALVAVATYDFVRRRNAEVFAFVAIVGIGQLLLNNGLKLIVHRQRPAVLHLVNAHGYSFPSGHTCAAAATWAAVALVLSRGHSRRVRAALAGGAALIAIAVATSRALLGVHWLSDVLGGLLLGWGWFLLVAIVFGGRRQRLGDPAEKTGAASPNPDAEAAASKRMEAVR
jgi:undecaprenyl-diphosphatase